jgi:hypothetical protein
VRFGNRQHRGVLEASESEVSASGDISPRPDHLRIKPGSLPDAALVLSDRTLKVRFDDLEQDDLMLGVRLWRLLAINRCEDDVANSD